MTTKYKLIDNSVPHFITFTVVGWLDVFSREIYKEKVLESLNYCITYRGLTLHAWVIMTNHVHLIVSSEKHKISGIVRDLKKFTSRQVTDLLSENDKESRKKWMMNMFRFTGSQREDNTVHQFWQFGFHPVELGTNEMLQQRLDYLHENPVKAGLVWEPWHYKYSSAIDYYTEEKGLLKIDKIE